MHEQTLSPSEKAARFSLKNALQLVETAIRSFPKAALFELAERGWTTSFQQVLACMISVRTLDEVTIPVAERLLAEAPTPDRLLKLSVDEVTRLIQESTFAGTKARNMLEIAKIAWTEYGGVLPCEEKVLLALPGIGPKCANLVLGIVGGQPKIGVDIHVHRVMNRWGYVATSTPEKTLKILEQKIPKDTWIEVNRLLMPFGKHICTGSRPKCGTCPVLPICPQIGVVDPKRAGPRQEVQKFGPIES
ncbi:MAG TPA: endonuclease III [Oligoflexus sp.]|uniref:endonuclease III domain-containing protein n=1 Tax=Oligoflexus sp. TaxID=1971216 RepID=UPI002D7EB4E4|nr:endonuclease III [Oligoflexus sp.]HET9238374.1 endonuclease III [Oligoflexus sp.]